MAGILTMGWSRSQAGRLALRRGASRLVRAALRLRSSPFRQCKVSSALVVSPHPDDETFGCGGALAFLTQAGSVVHVAFLTDGAASHPGHPSVAPSEIAAMREAEARMATGLLGVEGANLAFLGERDGELAHLDRQRTASILEKIAALLAKTSADTVILPCRRDGSTEHDAAFILAIQAVASTGLRPRILEFPVWSWWNPTLLLGPLFGSRKVWRVDLSEAGSAKARAVSACNSQTHPIPPDLSPALPEGFAAMCLIGEEFLFER